MNAIPITKVCQQSLIKADATPVMNKSFEKLLSNNFQVIIFERMAKKLLQSEYIIKNLLKFMIFNEKNDIFLSNNIKKKSY